ncbi:hypothetical protein KP509_34G061600 [Ceratopteris richardii]|uniref:Uncharacterized protein n=1 Tax=Ceratopteris richardii TaxID=49495 RepID=A0A8T2QLA5_CERRI|nr:hypothetical protein KP509_34G061600 [Ceratopteris richardii]
MVMVVKAHLFLLLLFFPCGRVAASSASSIDEDDAAIPIFDVVTDLVQQISADKGWDLDQLQIIKIDSEDARFTKAIVYELDIQIDNHVFPIKFIDEVTNWQKLGPDAAQQQSGNDNKEASWNLKSLQPVLKPFQLNGPLALSFQASFTTRGPSKGGMNFSHWKELRLAFGSSVKVSGAQEISLVSPVVMSLPVNRSSPVRSLVANILLLATRTQSAGVQNMEDSSQFSLQVNGPNLVASITGFNAPSHELNARSLELLFTEESEQSDEDVYLPVSSSITEFQGPIWPFPVLNNSDPSILVLEEILRAYMDYGDENDFTILNAKMAASTYVLFEFEIERNLDRDDFDPEVWPEWRTRPRVRRYNFQVLARVRDNTLTPIRLELLKHYKAVETRAWRAITSNISHPDISTLMEIHSPMTLDVK